ncbi:hypothetical protein BUALT_Bualt09G0066500 [Buddleja alternifolia]|uniref:UDP-glucuronate decarboxylase n=1 Tax=Buddleja alternifolia TaxID=168488 RepID=A0AAV6X773_9LAMI|nr:hypothetical protein BUALT_Bualt09G0066500 [Buddleja alternifolia]
MVGIGRKRIVVTGGAGFVGSHLVDKLIARGDDVIVVDSFFTGRKENVMHLFANSRFELIRHDVVEPILLEAIRKQPMTAYGDGKQARSFQYVSDLACHVFLSLRASRQRNHRSQWNDRIQTEHCSQILVKQKSFSAGNQRFH